MIRQRNYGSSNPFSESHRKFLPSNFCLFDVDGFFTDISGRIIGIYEGKYKSFSKDKGDFINTFYNHKNLQAGFLREISRKIPVWIHIEDKQKWFFVKDKNINESTKPDFDLIITENQFYVEDILNHGENLHNPLTVFMRVQEDQDRNKNLINLGNFFTETLGTKRVRVDDYISEEFISVKPAGKNNVQLFLNESDWTSKWKEMELF
jgi:hypothetical protein